MILSVIQFQQHDPVVQAPCDVIQPTIPVTAPGLRDSQIAHLNDNNDTAITICIR